MGGAAPSPIGRHLAEWRIRRGLTTANLATCSGLTERLIGELESGKTWVDQRGVLSALSSGLRLDPAELTGQPYAPHAPDHSFVHSLGWHARRYLARVVSGDGNDGGQPDQGPLAALLAGVLAAEADGDLVSAGWKVRTLLELVAGSQPWSGNHGDAALGPAVYAAVARFLRRIGYRDLAWGVLTQAHAHVEGHPAAVLEEEIHLLLDMGQAELAVVRAARAEPNVRAQVRLPLAVAHATMGREEESERLLAAAQESGASPQQVAFAGAFAAVERGAYDQALIRAAGAGGLSAGDRSALLVITASARARLAQYGAAARDLMAAESAAPLPTRLDPVAREVASILHSSSGEHVHVLGDVAARFGLE
ncbi:helix-turn-helix domain-containing protein [Streptomyces goshikiensis]|uniref:helix-turn-helix domain-containing protein n=1 Tax=Streptomyces goshikiensis TaxID=1942 RepID=UPI00369D8310